MKTEELQAWQQTRAAGKGKFILINAVAWGLPMLLIMLYINQPFADGWWSKAVCVHLLVWPLAGLAFALILWHLTERKYQRALKQLKEEHHGL
ncbi:hypothetical protein [Bowmanella denitrificans]|uniref:hypothetical protein n=1 Tax=Bowmanella denitrificans TaxID=366582 RepID=UPI000C9A98CE|nr:hypothetical protein [Bowmanella denitrificans]